MFLDYLFPTSLKTINPVNWGVDIKEYNIPLPHDVRHLDGKRFVTIFDPHCGMDHVKEEGFDPEQDSNLIRMRETRQKIQKYLNQKRSKKQKNHI